jgi:protein gp37
MAENSKIEWTTHTFNPWIGCTKIAPPCDHCYAESLANRYGWVKWGPHGERKRTSEANWRKPLGWDKAAKAAGERHRVFCASLADWLDNQVPESWREDLAGRIDATPNLDWLLLTKRIGNFDKHAPWHDDDIPSNVWLGITCGSQDEYDRDWPKLAKLQARVRFISYEPALGPLRLHSADTQPHWLICGGESGPGARYMEPAWAQQIQNDCRAEGVAFFMKQMTKKAAIPPHLMVRQFPAPLSNGVRREGNDV